MADIFVRVHSPLFFCHFPSTFLQVRLPIQFATFKSLFASNVQIQVTLSLLNCSLFTLSVQFLFTSSLSNCVLNTLGVQILVIWSLFNCDLVTLGVQILVTAPKIYVTYRVRMASRCADYYGMYIGFYSTSLLFGTGCVDGPGSLSGGAFNQLKLVTLNNVRTFLY